MRLTDRFEASRGAMKATAIVASGLTVLSLGAVGVGVLRANGSRQPDQGRPADTAPMPIPSNFPTNLTIIKPCTLVTDMRGGTLRQYECRDAGGDRVIVNERDGKFTSSPRTTATQVDADGTERRLLQGGCVIVIRRSGSEVTPPGVEVDCP